MAGGTMTVDVSNILQDIYDSEINITISWFWDSGINAIIGDTTNGVKKARGFDTIIEALAWLKVTIIELYPDSEFAEKYG